MANTSAATDGGWDLDRSDIRDIPYLGYDPSSFLGTVVDQTIGKRKPPLKLRYMDALTEAIKRRVLSGSGIAWLPKGAVSEEIASDVLMQVGGPEWEAKLTLSLHCSLDRLDMTGKRVWEAL